MLLITYFPELNNFVLMLGWQAALRLLRQLMQQLFLIPSHQGRPVQLSFFIFPNRKWHPTRMYRTYQLLQVGWSSSGSWFSKVFLLFQERKGNVITYYILSNTFDAYFPAKQSFWQIKICTFIVSSTVS